MSRRSLHKQYRPVDNVLVVASFGGAPWENNGHDLYRIH